MKSVIKNNLFLFGYIKKYAFAYIPLFFISAVFQALQIGLDVLGIKYVIDAVAGGDIKNSLFVILAYCAVRLITEGYDAWTNYYFAGLARKVSIGMTLERMSASQKLDFECFDIPEYYDAYSRALHSGEQQVSSLVGSTIAIVSNIVTFVSVSLIITSYSPWFLAAAAIQTIISYIVICGQNKLDYQYKYDNTRIGRIEGYYKNQCFSANVQMEDKLFHVVDFMKEKYQKAAEEVTDAYKKHLKKYHAAGFLQPAAAAVSMAASMAIAAILILAGRLTLGEFVSSLSAVQRLSGQLLSLVIQIPKMVQNSRYAEDYKKIVNYVPKIETEGSCVPCGEEKQAKPRPQGGHTMEFRNVSFRYPTSDKWVLRNVSFVIKPGQRAAIVGENGAGKTTIIKLILRLYDPTEGEILFDGRNLKNIPIESYRRNFTSVFQNFGLYCVTVEENIWFGSAGPTGEVLEKAGLGGRIQGAEDWSRMLTKKFNQDGIVLSGGEKQRLCIARALGRNAPIMLLDEPSSALDPIAEHEIIQVLLKESEAKSMVVITHRLSMCTAMDVIFYLENGCIAESGTHDQLMKTQRQYYQLFHTQAKHYIDGEK